MSFLGHPRAYLREVEDTQMSLRQRMIRRELVETEKKCNYYYEKQDELFFDFREQYMHYVMRRRFFLKDLLKVQLREFNHAKVSGKQRS